MTLNTLLHRRQFLAQTGGLALGACAIAPMTFAAMPNPGAASASRLLVVFLRGGYDAANVLVPYASPFYYEARPTIAIAKPDANNPQSALALNADWGLHPALRDTIGAMYNRREALFIPFAGNDDLSRSHFETQESMELGMPSQMSGNPPPGGRTFNSGFLNRLAQALASSNQSIAFTDALPSIFRGEEKVANVSLKGVGKPAFDQRQSSLLASMYASHPLERAVREGLDLRQEIAREFEQEMQMASRGAISAKGFELEAKRIARMLRESYQLGFVDVGGWDTHVNQGGATGALAGNLENLGRGLAAFAQDMGSTWKQTTVVVVSEFGRTFRENGTRGTDHGRGTVYWILGGGVPGGQVVGGSQRITAQSLLQNRDYPVLHDYRHVFANLFQKMYGLNQEKISQIFPGLGASSFQL
jgi:uncharacterized protein (DUF1501 family)